MNQLATRILLATLILALLASTSSKLQATTIVQTQGFVGKPNLQKLLEFNQFDPAKGVLQAVRLELKLDIDGGSLTVDNDGAQPVTVSVDLGAKGQLLSNDVVLLSDTLSPILSGASAVQVSTGSTFDLAADNDDGATFDPTQPDADVHHGGPASSSGAALVKSDYISSFTGTGVFHMTADMAQVLDFGGTGGVSGQFDPVTVSANVILSYDYLPEVVPEPSGLALACLGLLGIWRRRRAA